MATALIKFAQGGPYGTAGVAQQGVTGSAVSVANDNNTGVEEWVIILLDAPPNSVAYPPAANPQVLAQAVSNTPLTSFTPDVPGTYRVLLDVLQAGVRNRDIRCFGVPDGEGFILPPYQKNPDPLPLTPPVVVPSHLNPAAKPDEQNYSSQKRGWAGSGADGQLDQLLKSRRDLRSVTVSASPYVATANTPGVILAEMVTIGGTLTVSLPSTARVGQQFFVQDVEGAEELIQFSLPGGHTFVNIAGTPSIFGLSARFQRTGAVFLGGTDWMWLGTNIDPTEVILLSSVASTINTGFDRISTRPFNGSNLSGLDVTFEAVLEVTNIAATAELRLFNVTDAAVVASSLLTLNSLTPTLLSATLAVGTDLPAGLRQYELQMRQTGGGGSDAAVCSYCRLALASTLY